ncbi:unnamed protein product [Sphagnum jensenii]|uniref:Protein EXORDIUM-like n=1 Tax=Sphagnum jensenii TaxID=128206 RepID=A0ABP1BCN3_9BRYO
MAFGDQEPCGFCWWLFLLCVSLIFVCNSSISSNSVATVEARPSSLFSVLDYGASARKLSSLVNTSLVIPYHDGPLLSGKTLSVYVIWYGSFTPVQQAIVRDLLASFQGSSVNQQPSVSGWWTTTANYKDASNTVVGTVQMQGEIEIGIGSLGTSLQRTDLETLVLQSLETFPIDAEAIYLVLTAEDVLVQDFCMSSCAFHFFTTAQPATNSLELPYAWVGNSAIQCPGQCAWPYAPPQYGPQGAQALIPPNGDVGMDGMCINIGTMLAGTATDPFNNGYYQGDPAAPLEAATACTGIFGAGAYPGYAGQLLQDRITGASFNAYGVNNREFLLPAIWDPSTLQCTPP